MMRMQESSSDDPLDSIIIAHSLMPSKFSLRNAKILHTLPLMRISPAGRKHFLIHLEMKGAFKFPPTNLDNFRGHIWTLIGKHSVESVIVLHSKLMDAAFDIQILSIKISLISPCAQVEQRWFVCSYMNTKKCVN